MIREITIYELETGRIVSSGTTCAPETLPLGPGQAIIFDKSTSAPWAHYVRGMEIVAMPEKPGESYEFDYASGEWVKNDDLAWARVRVERGRRLSATDWVVTKAVETGEPMPPGWATYRQALRDVTSQSDPHNIQWPEPPSN